LYKEEEPRGVSRKLDGKGKTPDTEQNTEPAGMDEVLHKLNELRLMQPTGEKRKILVNHTQQKENAEIGNKLDLLTLGHARTTMAKSTATRVTFPLVYVFLGRKFSRL